MSKKYILQTKISSDISYLSINGGTSSLGEIPDTEWKNVYITEDRNLLENIISEFSYENKINMRIIEYFDIDKNKITNFEKIKNIEISGIKPFESLDGESVLAIFLSNNYSNCKECKFKSDDTCIGCMPEIEKWLKRES